jgi:hypothetical protein
MLPAGHDIYGVLISELNVKGYERSIRHYTGPPLPLRPAVHWTNGPPEGYDEPWRDPR